MNLDPNCEKTNESLPEKQLMNLEVCTEMTSNLVFILITYLPL